MPRPGVTRVIQPDLTHDYELDRTTTGTGVVFDVSLAALARLDAGSWFSPEFAGERVPRLSEVLALDSLEFEVELKVFTHEAVHATLRAVEQAGALDRTEFTSWNTPMLIALKERCPEARIGLFSPVASNGCLMRCSSARSPAARSSCPQMSCMSTQPTSPRR